MLIEYVDKIVDMRRHLVQEESRFPAELTRTFKGMETQSNPWGVDASTARRLGRRARHSDDGRQARRRVPLLGRLRRRPSTTAPRGRRRRSPRSSSRPASTSPSSATRSCATARPRAASATSTSSRRMAQMAVEALNGYKVQQDRHQLPALLQHAEERVPAVRRQLRGHPRHRASWTASSPRQARASTSAAERAVTYPRLLLPGPLQRRLRGAARHPAADSRRAAQGDAAQPASSACAAAPAAAACGWKRSRHSASTRGASSKLLETNPDAVAVACPFCMTMIDDGIKAKGMEEKVQRAGRDGDGRGSDEGEQVDSLTVESRSRDSELSTVDSQRSSVPLQLLHLFLHLRDDLEESPTSP